MNDHPFHRDRTKPVLLLVDDSPVTLKVLSRHLASEPYYIATAGNGMEAIDLIGDLAPDIIITDWDMPELDGIDLCRALRSCEQFGTTYIIILTAHSSEDRLVEAFRAGADDYLNKSFSRRGSCVFKPPAPLAKALVR